MENTLRTRLIPFLLSATIIIADQLTKWWVVATIPQGTIGFSFLSDFLWICHVRNSAIGFSLGSDLSLIARQVLFIVLPVILLGVLIGFMIQNRELRLFQRWMLAGIVGGGIGNVVDRIFRPEWVVDFVSVRVYGFLGFERWPTFNVADAAIVVTGILLMIHLLFFDRGRHSLETDSSEEVPHE